MRITHRKTAAAIFALGVATRAASASVVTIDNTNFTTITPGVGNYDGQSFSPSIAGTGTTDTVAANSPLPTTVYLDSAEFVRATSNNGNTLGLLYLELFTGGNGSQGTYVGTSTNAININASSSGSLLNYTFNNLALTAANTYSMEFCNASTGVAATPVTGRVETSSSTTTNSTYAGGNTGNNASLGGTGTGQDLRFLVTFNTSSPSPQNLTFNNTGGLGDGITWDTMQLNFNNGTGVTAFSSSNQDNVTFSDVNNGNYNVSIPTPVTPGSTVVNTTVTYSFGGAGGIGGFGGLTLAGGGTLMLGTSNTFIGVTDISSGTLCLTVGSALGGSSAITMNDANTGSGSTTLQLVGVSVASPITISNQGTGTTTLLATGGTASTISSNLILNQSINVNNSCTAVTASQYSGTFLNPGGLLLSGTLSGAGGITFTGGGVTLVSSGTNTYAGQTIVTGNTLLEYVSTSSTDPNSLLNISAGSAVVFHALASGKFAGLIGAGAFQSAAGTTTFTVGYGNDPVDSFSGLISGAFLFNKLGTGTLILSGSNAYTGTTVIESSGGTLEITNAAALGTSSVTIAKSGTASGTLQLNLSGGVNTIGNTFNGFSSTTFAGSSTVPDIENVAGNNIITSNLTVTGKSGNGVTVQSDAGLITLSGTISTNVDADRGIELNGPGNGVVSGIITNATETAFRVEKDGAGLWILSGSNTYGGTTTITGGTLQAGVATVPGVSGAFGLNSDIVLTNAAGVAMDLNNFNTSVGSLSGGGTAGGAVTMESATLTITGATSASYAGALSGTGGLVVNNSGVQTLTGINNFSGGTIVTMGGLALAGTAAIPACSNLSIGSVSTTATVTLLNHGGSAPMVLQLDCLSLGGTTGAWTGLLDLTNNSAIIHNGSLAMITNQIQQGYNGAGVNWQGSGGITSSYAAADSTHLTALGVMQNNQSGAVLFTETNQLDGVTPGPGDIIVKYTYFGDANLDGVVDGSDYSLIDNGYLNNLTGWFNGDFNYDGVVDGSDYTLIDNTFNMQGASLDAQFGGTVPTAISTAQIAGAASAVPEPAAIAMLALGAIGLLGRRHSPCRKAV